MELKPSDLRSPAGLLALQSLPRIGPKTALRLALFVEEIDERLATERDRWPELFGAARLELERCEQAGVRALSIFEEAYPDRLRAIPDPPPVLFIQGPPQPPLTDRAVAVVGTREPTESARSATEDIVAALAGKEWVIVSGLAKGIDSVAHGSALEHHTPTVAVMAAGLDRVYPKQNEELARAILNRRGALLGEHPLGQPPTRAAFVQRNRIQTGLSAAVIVTQTGVTGGTMHTVRHAATQGRPVFCAEPHTHHERDEGLRVLLETPADQLYARLPAWKDSKALCARLGSEPLARPITSSGLGDLLESLEQVLASDPQTVPEPRWWPEPAIRARGEDVVPADNNQAPLFAISD